MDLKDFVRESNMIEGILREPHESEIEAHRRLLAQDQLTVADVEEFVAIIAPGAGLRVRPGMNVRVGDHVPQLGGPEIKVRLETLLRQINKNLTKPFEAHCEYETLHPFMDGNGRSGRVIWLWHEATASYREPEDVIYRRGFLHTWYYRSLQCYGGRLKS